MTILKTDIAQSLSYNTLKSITMLTSLNQILELLV